MEIRIPKRAQDYRIRHYAALANPQYLQLHDLGTKTAFLSDLTGVPIYQIRQLKEKEIEKLYRVVLGTMTNFKIGKTPPKQLTINGKEYELINPDTVSAGWHIDFGQPQTKTDNVRRACLFYFPKGQRYGELDANNNLINPIKDRYLEFEEHFPLQHFIEANAFFLKMSAESMRLSMARLKGTKWGKKVNQLLRYSGGKRLSTSSQKNSPGVTGTK